MATVTKAKNILANTTGKVVYVSPRTQAQAYQIGVKILKSRADGKNVSQSLIAYRNAAMVRGFGNIASYLERVCRYKDLFGRYVIDETFVPEFCARIEAANNEIMEEASAFVESYSDKKQEVEGFIMDICIANKCKKRAKGIITSAMKNFPTKAQIMSGRIYYTMDTDGTEAYDELSQETKDLVDASRIYQAEYNRCQHIASRCNPVLESLLKFSNQVITAGKLHGATVTSYLKAVSELRVANETEFVSPLPDLTDFLNMAGAVIDNPVDYVDCMIMGFVRFYATQGMIDNIPYDAAVPAGYTREAVEEIGSDPNNSFSIVADSVRAFQMRTTPDQSVSMAVGA